MKAVHVISDSDAPVMLGAGLYLVKAYLTAWKIVMEQKGGVGCSCGLRIWPSRKMRGPFRTRPAPSRAKSFLFKRDIDAEKTACFSCPAADPSCGLYGQRFRRLPCRCAPGMGGHGGKGRHGGVRIARQGSHCDRDRGLSPGCRSGSLRCRDGPGPGGGAISWKKMVSTASHSGIMV